MKVESPTPAQLNDVLMHVYHVLRKRRPQLFQRGEPWRPGGVWELRDHLWGLIRAARASADEHREEYLLANERHVCAKCAYQSPCGYCPVREREACVLLQELDVILDVVRRSLS